MGASRAFALEARGGNCYQSRLVGPGLYVSYLLAFELPQTSCSLFAAGRRAIWGSQLMCKREKDFASPTVMFAHVSFWILTSRGRGQEGHIRAHFCGG